MSYEESPKYQYRKELRRKAFHLLVLVLPLVQAILPSDPQTKTLLVIGGAIFAGFLLGMEMIRLRNPFFFANYFARSSERDKIAAYIPTYFVVYFIFLSFGFKIAVISMLVSALGDAAAALVGMRFGTHPMPFTEKKSLEGLFAGFSVTFFVGGIYAKLWLALGLVLIFVATDFIEDPKTTFLSDNFLNPFFFAIVLHHFSQFLR